MGLGFWDLLGASWDLVSAAIVILLGVKSNYKLPSL